MEMIYIGPCKCGGYGQCFDEETEANTGRCHIDINELAVLVEREACAKICDEQAKEPECFERAQYCAELIRARYIPPNNAQSSPAPINHNRSEKGISYALDTKCAVATVLANDLAEAYIASNIADMMITGSRDKASAIRKLSEANTDRMDGAVQEYRAAQRAIYSAISDLLDGYEGYKLLNQE